MYHVTKLQTHPTQFYCGVYWLISYKKRILMMKMQEEISCEIQPIKTPLLYWFKRSCKSSQHFPYRYIDVSSRNSMQLQVKNGILFRKLFRPIVFFRLHTRTIYSNSDFSFL